MGKQPPDDETGGGRRKPLPQCKALLLCSRVIVDEFSKEPTLVAILNRLDLPEIPGVSAPMAAFLQVADGIGEYNLTIEVQDLQNDDVIAHGEIGKVLFRRRLVQLNRVIPIPAIQFPHIGNYDLVVLLDGSELERQQFSVHLKAPT